MEFLQHLQWQLFALARQILSLSAWFLIFAVVFVPLERLFPLRPLKVFRRSFLMDTSYYLVNGILVRSLLALIMAAVALGLQSLMPEAVLSWSSSLPLWARLAVALVVGEFGYYWGHRWTHEIPFLWRFHAIHHNPEEIDWLVNTHAHPVDIVFSRFCALVPMFALGLNRSADGLSGAYLPFLILIIGTFWGFFIHANLRWRFGWLSYLVSTPAYHHWHHTKAEHTDKNYASMLPIMDLLFGSWYMPAKQWPVNYGINGPVAEGLVGQLLQPFGSSAEQAPLQ